MTANTIIAAPFEPAAPLRAMVLDQMETATAFHDGDERRRLFKIRAADSEGHRSSANILASRRYAWRGYQVSPAPVADTHNRITLIAVEHHETIGTLSVGFDGPNGLLVDELFADEVAALRNAGRSVCEFTKLAVDSMVRSKRVLASLFHVAYIYAHRLGRIDCLLIEVNPRHVRYYERMLGFKAAGPERLNKRVNAPAVLMCLDLAHAHEQIGLFGGQPHLSEVEKSLYPYFFSVEEEAGIVGRLQHEPASWAALRRARPLETAGLRIASNG